MVWVLLCCLPLQAAQYHIKQPNLSPLTWIGCTMPLKRQVFLFLTEWNVLTMVNSANLNTDRPFVGYRFEKGFASSGAAYTRSRKTAHGLGELGLCATLVAFALSEGVLFKVFFFMLRCPGSQLAPHCSSLSCKCTFNHIKAKPDPPKRRLVSGWAQRKSCQWCYCFQRWAGPVSSAKVNLVSAAWTLL